MPSDPVLRRYDPVAVTLHWLIAIALFCQVTLGFVMQEIPKQPQGPRAWWFNFHKSIGLTLLVLIVIRLAWRLAHRPPALPSSLPRWQQLSAPILHRLLYVVMLLLPISGYISSAYSGRPVLYFGMALPSWVDKDESLSKLFNGIHEIAGWTLIVLFAGHVAAAIAHVASRDGIIRRMWPSAGPGPRPNL